MSKIREIFKRQPEKMSRLATRFFTLPVAYMAYIVLSLLIPRSMGLFSTCLSYILLCVCILLGSSLLAKADIPATAFSCGKFNFKSFGCGFAVMFIAGILCYGVFYLISPQSFVFSFKWDGLVYGWIVSLILLTVASFTEEFVFRIYILHFASDSLPKSVKSKLIHCFISAVLFTAFHFSNPEVNGSSAIWSMLYYFLFGFTLMAVTIKRGSIEYAWGIHLANNLISAWIVSYNDAVLSTVSVFTKITPIGAPVLIQGIICMFVCVLFS